MFVGCWGLGEGGASLVHQLSSPAAFDSVKFLPREQSVLMVDMDLISTGTKALQNRKTTYLGRARIETPLHWPAPTRRHVPSFILKTLQP